MSQNITCNVLNEFDNTSLKIGITIQQKGLDHITVSHVTITITMLLKRNRSALCFLGLANYN